MGAGDGCSASALPGTSDPWTLIAVAGPGVKSLGRWMAAMDGLRVVPVARTARAGTVLRLVDGRAGRSAQVEAGAGLLLRVWVHFPPAGDPGQLFAVRALLVADVLSRAVELFRGQALVGIAHASGAGGPGGDRSVEVAAAGLGIKPPAAQGGQDALLPALGGPADVEVAGWNDQLEGAAGGIHMGVGAVEPDQVPAVADRLAVRLALLTHVHHEPAVLTPDVLAEAERTLARWRPAVASWAQAPSKPMCAEILDDALAGLKDNLAVPRVLAALHRLEREPGLPAGSRFETAAYLDRVLGLELTREVGRPRLPRPAP